MKIVLKYLPAFLLVFALPSFAAGIDPFFDALDLTRPELSDVRTAYESGDVAAARKSFAAYLRARKTPLWAIESSERSKRPPGEDQRVADDALHHKFESVGYTYQFGDKIDWSLDPTTLPDSPVAPNAEWTWQLNRHNPWASLARVYITTGDLKYARELCNEMQDWIRANPVPVAQKQQFAGARWRPIEAGLRMTRSWPEIYTRLVHDRAALPDDALLDMVESMREHAEYLEVTTSWGIRTNHITVENSGLYGVGVLFPEFKRAADWRRDGSQRQLEQLGYQVYPDGAQKELAPGYHIFCLHNCMHILTLAQLNHLPLPDGYQSRLENMYAALMWQMSPARTTPQFNDSGDGSILIELQRGLKIFPDHADWQWFVSGGTTGAPPAETSHPFPYAGWAVMRSGWEKDARNLIMECGPFGTAHQHEDKLSFLLHAYGSTLVTECGTFMYEKSPSREYALSARAHNEISVDSLEQNRRGGPSRYYSTDAPIDFSWQSTPTFDYAQGTYGAEPDERWGPDRIEGFLHTRRVLYVKPDYFIVIDTVRPPENDMEHVYESAFHLRAQDVAVDSSTSSVRTLNKSANLAILPLPGDGLSVHVVTAQKHPIYQGWEADELTSLKLLPAPTPIFTVRTKGMAKFLYVFSPSKPGAPGPVKSVRQAHVDNAVIAADIELTDGKTAQTALLNDGTVVFTQSGQPPIQIHPSVN